MTTIPTPWDAPLNRLLAQEAFTAQDDRDILILESRIIGYRARAAEETMPEAYQAAQIYILKVDALVKELVAALRAALEASHDPVVERILADAVAKACQGGTA